MLRQLQIASRLILLLFFFAFSGCVTSRMAANRIVTAPNRHRDTTGLNNNMANVWTGIQTNIAKAGNLSPFYYATVPVGPPAANLSILEIPAQDYHVSIVSKIAVLRNGRHTLSLFLNANTNSASSYKPLDQPATIVLLHGYMLTKESMLPWALQLSQAGYRVILVDLRGHGKSTGDTVSFGKNEVNDLRQLVDYLTARGQCDDTLGVLGFSYGATLAMHWAAHDPRISTVVAIAPYNQPDAAFERLAQELKIPINHRTAQKAVILASERLQLNWAEWSGEAAIRQLHIPVLLVGGGKDSISRPDDIATLRTAAVGKVEAIHINEANHFVLPMWFHELANPVEAWFHAQIGKPTVRNAVQQ